MGVCSYKCFQDYVDARRKHDRRLTSKAPPRPVTMSSDLRRRVKARDGERCRFCGTGNRLELHHIIYRSQGGPDADDNLITLCSDHHRLVHTSKPRYMPLCQAYIAELEAGRRLTLPQIERWQRDVS